MKAADWLLFAALASFIVMIGSLGYFIYLMVGIMSGGPLSLTGFFVSVLLANVAILALRLSVRLRRKITRPAAV